MNALNILFTSAGRRVSLIRHFKQAIRGLNLEGRIVAADLQKNAPATFVADVKEPVPRVTDPNYIDAVKDICRKHDIRLVIPLIDTELFLFSLHKEEFEELGITLLVSSPEVNRICLDKRETYKFFKTIGVQTPGILEPSEILANPKAKYPFLLKPSDGSCSVGVTKIRNAKELEFFIDYIPNAIVQEYVTGDEYTLDVLVDFKGRVRSVVPRLRIETRAGEISKGCTVKNPALIAGGKAVVEALHGAVGCITVQCFVSAEGGIKFIEINPRFGGGFPLSMAAGADFPRWIIEEIIGIKRETAVDEWQDGLVMLRYDEAIFVQRETII